MAIPTENILSSQSQRPSYMAVSYRYDNVPNQHQADGLLRMAQGLIIAAVVGALLWFTDPPSPESALFIIVGNVITLPRIVHITMILSSFATWFAVGHLLNRGELRTASRVFVLDLFVIMSLIYLIHLPTNAAILGLSVPLVAAGVLLTQREVTWMGLGTVGIILVNVAGLSFSRSQLDPIEVVIVGALICLVNAIMLQTFAGGRAVLLEERVRLTEELQALNRTLEQRVADRTRDLVLAAEVSKETVSVIDLENLLPRAVDMTRSAFSLYHVALYTYDETTQSLNLKAASGEPGKDLKTTHELLFLQSPNGAISKAARDQKAVLIDDVYSSPIFTRDAALPDVKSEVALPMVVSGQLIGVLALRSNVIQRFAADDLRVFQTLVDQIAVSIRNSQLFSQTIVARQEAEQSNQVKSAFLASMSHELRTPLNSIINFTKFVSRGVMGPVTEKQVSTLTNVINSGEHLLSLINDVLDISKIESGSLSLFLQDVDMAEIISSVEKSAQSLLVEKPVTLVTNIAPGLPTLVGDPQRILQVVLNIVSNACKFTKQGEIRISAQEEKGEVLVSISDTGPGIDPEDYKSVFEKFKQTETGLRQGGGTGLGMPISRSLIEAHGGQLWIESTRGQGATFKFTLPLQARVDPRMVSVES